MKKGIILIIILIVSGICIWFGAKGIIWYKNYSAERALNKERNEAVDNLINTRIEEQNKNSDSDPFGEDNKINILLIGLDKRIGTTSSGHCDAIQMVQIDKNSQTVSIIAVPRGTYSPLPPGKGTTSSDYYVSNACDLGGLEYGINQIEKILRQKADYLAIVGFSETLGILRNLKLPTTETLQWLRHRQSYQIGEPQRAHNHSTFIKQMMLEHIPKERSSFDTTLQYLIYRRLKTDLSFAQVKIIIDDLSRMNLSENSDNIILSMNPPYPIEDIAYDKDALPDFLKNRIEPIKHLLSKADFSGIDNETSQIKLMEMIEKNSENDEFSIWAFENYLWLQIDDDEKRLEAQYDFLVKYITTLDDIKEREVLIADYILEMEHYEELNWAQEGRVLMEKELGY